jgi:hypothetical protein
MTDALAAGFAFVLLATTLGCGPSSAHPNPGAFGVTARPAAIKALGESGPRPIIEIATAAPNGADAVIGRTSFTAAWALLAIAVSLLTAVNLAFIRHLRRAYAPISRRNSQSRPADNA